MTEDRHPAQAFFDELKATKQIELGRALETIERLGQSPARIGSVQINPAFEEAIRAIVRDELRLLRKNGDTQ